jgi:hypothetical protein
VSATIMPSAVQEILGRNYDGKTSLSGYIKTATNLLTRLVTMAAASGQSSKLDDDTQERIGVHLAAHFYQRHDPGFSSKNTGRSSAAFHGQTGMHLESTMYGQDAMDLDPTGGLIAINKGGRVKLMWLGKPPSSQIDAADRD